MWGETEVIEFKGYVIKSWYAGLNNYVVEKDGTEILRCWDPGDVMRLIGVDPAVTDWSDLKKEALHKRPAKHG